MFDTPPLTLHLPKQILQLQELELHALAAFTFPLPAPVTVRPV